MMEMKRHRDGALLSVALVALCGAALGCSTTKPRYYLFSENDSHDLISGPENKVEDLYIDLTGKKRPHKGEVIKVPVGTIVVSERQQNSEGEVLDGPEGWFALNDEPALSGTEITDPKQELGEFNEPTVTFSFTDDGREAFQEVTRQIAQRGQARAFGPVSGEQAEALSGHFVVVLDN